MNRVASLADIYVLWQGMADKAYRDAEEFSAVVHLLEFGSLKSSDLPNPTLEQLWLAGDVGDRWQQTYGAKNDRVQALQRAIRAALEQPGESGPSGPLRNRALKAISVAYTLTALRLLKLDLRHLPKHNQEPAASRVLSRIRDAHRPLPEAIAQLKQWDRAVWEQIDNMDVGECDVEERALKGWRLSHDNSGGAGPSDFLLRLLLDAYPDDDGVLAIRALGLIAMAWDPRHKAFQQQSAGQPYDATAAVLLADLDPESLVGKLVAATRRDHRRSQHRADYEQRLKAVL